MTPIYESVGGTFAHRLQIAGQPYCTSVAACGAYSAITARCFTAKILAGVMNRPRYARRHRTRGDVTEFFVLGVSRVIDASQGRW